MDGRITALRVGFLSSSHQLAGVLFLLPALMKTLQGFYHLLVFFAIVLTGLVVCLLVSGRFDFGVPCSLFSCARRVGFGKGSAAMTGFFWS